MNTCSYNQLMNAFTTELTKYPHAELSDLILKTYGIYKYTAVNHYLIIMCSSLVYSTIKKYLTFLTKNIHLIIIFCKHFNTLCINLLLFIFTISYNY